MPLPRLSWHETSTYPVGPHAFPNGIGRQYIRPYPYKGGIYDQNYLSFINNILREISNGAIETLNYSTVTTVTSSQTLTTKISAPSLSPVMKVDTLIDGYTGLLNNPGNLHGETLKMYRAAFKYATSSGAPMEKAGISSNYSKVEQQDIKQLKTAISILDFVKGFGQLQEQFQFPGAPNKVEPVKISYCLPTSLKALNINPFKHQPPPNSGPIISNPIYNLVNFNYAQLVLIVDALEKRKTMFNNDKLTGYYQSSGVLYNNTYPSVYYGWPGLQGGLPDNTLPVLNDIQFYGLSNTTPTQTIDVNNILDPGK